MALYAVTTTTYGPDDLATVAAAMEVAVETFEATTKTIRCYQIVGCARDNEVMGILVVDT